jgi:ABC-type dipeptide/oligopeptide/nickel transport system permease subunit
LATAVLIVFAKLGGGASFVGVAMMMAVPYGLCVGLAAGFRKHQKEGWIVFVGTVICAVLGLHGVYAAFFSGSPADPWKALMPPLYQICVVIAFAGVAACSFAPGKRGDVSEEKANSFRSEVRSNGNAAEPY